MTGNPQSIQFGPREVEQAGKYSRMDGSADKADIKRHLAWAAEKNPDRSQKHIIITSDFPLEIIQTNHGATF